MVFVTVGNSATGFKRLLEAIDRLAGEGIFEGEDVLMQVKASAGFKAVYCQQVAYLSDEQYAQTIRDARLVV